MNVRAFIARISYGNFSVLDFMSVFEHPEYADHEKVAFFKDAASGLHALIAIHNTNLGAALGGCRMWSYANENEALIDVLRLSKGMSYKAALAGLPMGGGKSVIIGDPRNQKTPAMMRAMGRFVESCAGNYVVAEDSGISVQDIHEMSDETQFISGHTAKYSFDGRTSDGNPGPATAYGTYVAIKTCVEYRMNTNLSGVRVGIQGLGNVGWRLAEHLFKAGAKLVVTDIYPDNLNRAMSCFDARVVSPDALLSESLDVLAPCALGSVINPKTVEQIDSIIIAGAANNQLSSEKMGGLLREREILYAPDFVVNAGGIIDIHHQRIDSSNEALRDHLNRIGESLINIFDLTKSGSKNTNDVANLIAEQRLNMS
jgi:leucine dehydrogenase